MGTPLLLISLLRAASPIAFRTKPLRSPVLTSNSYLLPVGPEGFRVQVAEASAQFQLQCKLLGKQRPTISRVFPAAPGEFMDSTIHLCKFMSRQVNGQNGDSRPWAAAFFRPAQSPTTPSRRRQCTWNCPRRATHRYSAKLRRPFDTGRDRIGSAPGLASQRGRRARFCFFGCRSTLSRERDRRGGRSLPTDVSPAFGVRASGAPLVAASYGSTAALTVASFDLLEGASPVRAKSPIPCVLSPTRTGPRSSF